jgi:ATP-binding cassette, subfamily C, bacterial CydD
MNLDKRLLAQAKTAGLILTGTILAGLVGGVLAIVQALQLSRIVNAVFLGGKALGDVFPWLMILLGIILARAVVAFINETTAAAAAARVKNNLREMLMVRLFKLGPIYTDSRPGGELAATVLQGIEALDAYFSQYLPQVVLAGVIPLAILIMVFPIDPLSGVILLVTGPLIPLFMFLIGSNAEKLTQKQFAMLNRMSAFLLDALQGLRTLKELGQSKEQAENIQTVSERYRQVTMSVLRLTFLSALVLELLGTMSTAIIAVQVGLRLLYGKLGFEQAFFLLVIAPDFYLPLRTLGLRFHAAMNGISAAKKIYEILEEPVFSLPVQRVRDIKKIENTADISIRFDAVSFAYPGRNADALDGVSFEIKPRQLVALAGASGAGKSTIAQVLLRFCEPQNGKVWVNELALNEISPRSWRQQVAWVSQRPHLINATIAENLRIARADASLDELRSAVQMAQLENWILSLPLQFDTPVGEGGARLSGGQAQRLALARAFLRGAPLLVLDEPTAHLDPTEEALLEATTRELCKGRSVLVIAHRLATVYRADQIVMMDHGRILEIGTHTELLAHDRAYAKMVATLERGST